MPPRRIASAWLALIAVPAFTACERPRSVFEPTPPPPYVPEQPKDTGPIHVGVFGSLHGREGAFGRAEWQGITLAVEERNATKRVHDRPVEMVVLDDLGRVEAAQAAGERYQSSDRVALVLGGTSPVRARIAARAAGDIPLLSPSFPSGNAAASSSLFGGAPPAEARVQRLAEYLRESSRDVEVAVLPRTDRATDREMASALQLALRDGPNSRVTEHAFTADSLLGLLRQWSASPPPIVFVPFDGADAAALVATARKRGLATTRFVLAGEPDIEALPEEQRGLLDGTIVVSAFDPRLDSASQSGSATSGDAHGHADAGTARESGAAAQEFGAAAQVDFAAQAAFASRYRARFEAEPNERAWLGFLAATSALDSLARAPAFWPKDVRRALETAPRPTSPFTILRVEAGRLARVVPPQN